MKTITMTKNFLVAEDGFTVETWAEGETRETIDQLADDLVGAKVAVSGAGGKRKGRAARNAPAEPAPEPQAEAPAPETEAPAEPAPADPAPVVDEAPADQGA